MPERSTLQMPRSLLMVCLLTGLGLSAAMPVQVASADDEHGTAEPDHIGLEPGTSAEVSPDDGGAVIAFRPAIDPLTNDLLDSIESAGKALHTMQATVIYDRRFVLQGDQHIRTGNLFFESGVGGPGGQPVRRFAIAFDQLFVDQVVRRETQRFVFDGRWLVERDDASKRFVAREVAPPGAAFDPLRLGEGPMPIPLGQRKADILERYDARATWGGAEWEENDEAAVGYRAAVEGARQLVLTPRPAFEDIDDFREIRLWYADRNGHLLPLLSRTVSRAGDVAFVRLLAFRINDDRPASVQRLSEALRMLPPDEPGWDIQRIEGRWDERDIIRRGGAQTQRPPASPAG